MEVDADQMRGIDIDWGACAKSRGKGEVKEDHDLSDQSFAGPFCFPFLHRHFLTGKGVPDTLVEIHWEVVVRGGGLADAGEAAAAILSAGVVQGIVPPACFPAVNHALEVMVDLVVPAIDFEGGTVGHDLLRVVLGLEDGDATDKAARGVQPLLAGRPAIPGELTAEFPLVGPGGSKAGGGLIVKNPNRIREVADQVGPACVEEWVARDGMVDAQGVSEAELDPGLARGESDGEHPISSQGVAFEVEFECACCTFEGLG